MKYKKTHSVSFGDFRGKKWQIAWILFLQNKPNSIISKIAVTPFWKSIYYRLNTIHCPKNKPNSNPIKPIIQNEPNLNLHKITIKNYVKRTYKNRNATSKWLRFSKRTQSAVVSPTSCRRHLFKKFNYLNLEFVSDLEFRVLDFHGAPLRHFVLANPANMTIL